MQAKVIALCAPLSAVCAAPALAADPLFVDRAPALGLSHSYTGGWEHFVGGGVATFDCSGDAYPELYLAGGDSPASLLRNHSAEGGLRFVEQTPEALALTGVIGAYPLDVDSDGLMDLYVLRVGQNQLLRGLGECAFAEDDTLLPAMPEGWSTAFSATWEAGHSLPTLAVGNYVDRSAPDGPFEACDTNWLLRPEGTGYGAPVALDPGYCPLSMLFSDWRRSGRADLRISNDRHYYVRGGQEQMWAMTQPPHLFTEAEGWRPYMLWGMGIASRDITGDGLPEVYLSSMGDQKLQTLAPEAHGPSYDDATYDRGTTAHRPYTGGDGRPSTGWQTAFGDVQNDGRDDLFVAKGNVEMMPDSAQDDPNNLLIQQPDGRFVERGAQAGVASMVRGRGAALEDLNLDGRLDLVVVNRRAPVEIYENQTQDAGHWLLLRATQAAPNRDAIGGWIEVATEAGQQVRELTVGGGHASGAQTWQHFGLGAATSARVRVIWPDGTPGDWQEIAANQRVTLAQ